jgi:lysophospholipase L1-like esterase
MPAFFIPSFFLALVSSTLAATPRFSLMDSDRVVLVGSTLIEREQRYGYWETVLTQRYPDRNITFRNLGWSGDTVWGEARIGFDLDNPKVGFERLRDHVLALKPTVIIVGYGTNESFAGPVGLPHFRDGLGQLLDSFAPTKARIVLLAPLLMEDQGRPLPDPTKQNANLRLYGEAIQQIANRRGHTFVNLSALFAKEPDGGSSVLLPLTDNGMHLTPFGYFRTANLLLRALDPPESDKPFMLKGTGEQTIVVRQLPAPPAPKIGDARPMVSSYHVTVEGLKPGKYVLTVDGRHVATGSAEDLAGDGMIVVIGPEFVQAEQLRQAIVTKNREYFYRWRPQNETYLFGFRKHEQGNNAVEIPQFDPLVARLDQEIARLRKPVAHKYQIFPLREVDK